MLFQLSTWKEVDECIAMGQSVYIKDFTIIGKIGERYLCYDKFHTICLIDQEFNVSYNTNVIGK